jgi:hypothetical protein
MSEYKHNFPSEISEKAAALYLQRPKKYNCAQAVAAAFDRFDLLETLASCGGGKAPEGLCGALFAAISLSDPAGHENIRKQFKQEIGHCECQSIRQSRPAGCADCVRCAAGFAGSGSPQNLSRQN